MQEHEKWLQIAKDDFAAAKGLVSLDLFSTVTYHCQQAAEKSLKGYLAFKKQEIRKTHDLLKLLELCIPFDQNFMKLYEAVKKLNPFSTKFRYPTEYDISDLTVATLAIKHAQCIMSFVIKKIEEPGTGQGNIFESEKS